MPVHQQVFDSMGAESVREPLIAEHVVQTSVREHGTERDGEPTFAAATIDIASGDSQRGPDVAGDAAREPAPQDKEARADRASRVPPSFQLPPDLVQVETSPDRAQQGQAEPAAAAEEGFESRARRPRPPEEQVPSEPLVQVETRH